jgi:hypothetical protein
MIFPPPPPPPVPSAQASAALFSPAAPALAIQNNVQSSAPLLFAPIPLHSREGEQAHNNCAGAYRYNHAALSTASFAPQQAPPPPVGVAHCHPNQQAPTQHYMQASSALAPIIGIDPTQSYTTSMQAPAPGTGHTQNYMQAPALDPYTAAPSHTTSNGHHHLVYKKTMEDEEAAQLLMKLMHTRP